MDISLHGRHKDFSIPLLSPASFEASMAINKLLLFSLPLLISLLEVETFFRFQKVSYYIHTGHQLISITSLVLKLLTSLLQYQSIHPLLLPKNESFPELFLNAILECFLISSHPFYIFSKI
jgi:hypothetical protein